MPSNRGIGGTGESFSGEHGLRVARGAFICVASEKDMKDDERLRVCSGVSILTRPAGEREGPRRNFLTGRASASARSREGAKARQETTSSTASRRGLRDLYRRGREDAGCS